jgi:hypothetical protein
LIESWPKTQENTSPNSLGYIDITQVVNRLRRDLDFAVFLVTTYFPVLSTFVRIGLVISQKFLLQNMTAVEFD